MKFDRVVKLLSSTSPRLNDTLKAAEHLGCEVRKVPGTGDALVTFPNDPIRERVNIRNKDAPKHLCMRLRHRLQDLQCPQHLTSPVSSTIPANRSPSPSR